MVTRLQRPERNAFSAWLVALALTLVGPSKANAEQSALVFPGASGRLLYTSQPNGVRITDFSMVGYRYGEASIPDIAFIHEGRVGLRHLGTRQLTYKNLKIEQLPASAAKGIAQD